MIGGVTRHILPHVPGVPHLHVNRPLNARLILSNFLINLKCFGDKQITFPFFFYQICLSYSHGFHINYVRHDRETSIFFIHTNKIH